MLRIFGLTLVELLVGLLIVTILSMLCLPLGLSIYQRNQLQLIENEISSAVRYARNMALLYKQRLALTPLPNTNDWSYGMILFVDNKSHQYSGEDSLIHQWQWQHYGAQVVWLGFHSKHYLLFFPELKHASTSGHFDIQIDQQQPLKLVVNRFGRIARA